MKKILDTTESVAAFFLLAIALLTAGNVFIRNVADVQVPDWYDGSRLLLGISIFWGMAIATQQAVPATHSSACAWFRLRPNGRCDGTAPRSVGVATVCNAGGRARMANASSGKVTMQNRPSPV